MVGPEVNPASGAKLGLPSDHAGGHPLHIGYFRTAQIERIARTSLLLFGGVGPAGCGPDPQRGGQYDSTAKSSSSKCQVAHDSPNLPHLKFWVSNKTLASGCAHTLRRDRELPTWNRGPRRS